MARNPVTPIESSRPGEGQTAALDGVQHTAEAQLEREHPAGGEAGAGVRPGNSPGDSLAEKLLQDLDGATLDDIMKRGLSSVKHDTAATTAAPKALSKGDKHLKARKQVAQKKMGITVQPLQSQEMMYKGASGSDSASAFLARREGRIKRRQQ